MFTGLIEEIGKLQRIESRGEALVLTISARKVLEDVKLGDSISVNGVCLTVVSYNGASFSADVMPETYRHTNLKKLTPGEPVNLERAMLAGGRFGGHIVQGHVDGTATIVSRTPEANAVVFRLRPEQTHLMRLVVPQGSITLDGISLTVVSAERTSGTLTVSIIPHTLAQTALEHKRPGDTVNVENDILGKYIDHLLHDRHGSQPAVQTAAAASSGLTEAKLREFGF
ncbi:riboflavin synthase [Cohnella sp. JJ-181]|uniref:riboflavin synthase n=1 Tax=Cohnella rhizoplanae TaxID=2974897 RepID=UPI0022FF8EDD|nr:riboflavin synthase [Cohnella sp. JJ-181]CAI6057263.1 Riboflavin synthase [Cohnella sp. JJ-181]